MLNLYPKTVPSVLKSHLEERNIKILRFVPASIYYGLVDKHAIKYNVFDVDDQQIMNKCEIFAVYIQDGVEKADMISYNDVYGFTMGDMLGDIELCNLLDTLKEHKKRLVELGALLILQAYNDAQIEMMETSELWFTVEE